MTGIFNWLFDPGLAPKGAAFDWRPDLLVIHGASDALMAAAYVSIALALLSFIRRSPDFRFNWFFGMFAAFILSVGLTHILGAITLWRPWHGLFGTVKLITAGISVATAIVIWPLIPRLVALPSPARYASANRRLQKAMDALEQSNAELESRVTARTAELEEATLQLETRRQEAERAAEERTVMLREMHHRTGNNLQVISSFVGLTLRGVKDPAATNAIREIRARLAAITDVNRLLLRSDTFASGRADEYLQRLTEDLKETSLPPGAQITISVDLAPVEMSADKLTYLGLVAVELITNSVKYAFPEGRIGNVTVRLSETPGGLIFEVADDGKGYDLSAALQGPGAGVTIVRQFASRLNALVEQYSAPGEGTRVRLNFKPEGEGLNDAAPA
jgi:two-component sensor histidine kinase